MWRTAMTVSTEPLGPRVTQDLIVGRKLWFILLMAAFASVSFSCGPSATPDEEQRAIDAARKEAVERGWKKVEVRSTVFTNGHWEILLWRLPKVPGGFATLDVTSDGKVIGFHPGE
jgi:hypothetical protein